MKELILADGTGRKRKHFLVTCLHCGDEFPKPARFVKSSPNHYCSIECRQWKSRDRVKTNCAYCGKEIWRKQSRLQSLKSGLPFCCKEHKDLAQSHKHKILRCGVAPTWDESTQYRAMALAHYGAICEWCQDDIEELLDVHHLDRDRGNNNIENLIVLCVRCHAMETRKLVVVELRRPVAICEIGALLIESLGA